MTAKPQCVVCGVVLPRFTNPNHDPILSIPTADGEAPRWGGHGDNLVCTNACGRILAVRIVRTVPGVLDLLPVDLRADLRPPPKDSRGTLWTKLDSTVSGDAVTLIAPHVEARRRAGRTKL